MLLVLRNQDQIARRHIDDFDAIGQPGLATAFGEEMKEHDMLSAGKPLFDARQAAFAADAPRGGEFGVEVERAFEADRLQNVRQGIHGVSGKNGGVAAVFVAKLGKPVRRIELIWGRMLGFMTIVTVLVFVFGGISLACADELAAGSRLGLAVCGYGAVFWGVRLALQAVFDAKPHLTAWWLRAGYHVLTVLFLSFTAVYGYAALR